MAGVCARVTDLNPLYKRRGTSMFSDDEGGMRTLRQPLMDVADSSSDEEAAGGLLPHSPSSVREFGGDAVASDSWATRRKRRRRKDDDDLGEIHKARGVLAGMTSVEPKFVRSFGRWVLSLSSAAAFFTGSGGGLAKAKTSPRADKSAASASALLVHSKRKAEPIEDMTERALAWMAGLTVALALLLIVTVAIQSA